MKSLVRLATQEDVPTYLEYTRTTPDNLFDPDISGYPSLRTLAVEVNGRPSLYAPFHPVIVIESLAHRPNTTARENALCIYRADKVIEDHARHYGIAEVHWQCADSSLIETAQRYGYTLVKTAVLKKKILGAK